MGKKIKSKDLINGVNSSIQENASTNLDDEDKQRKVAITAKELDMYEKWDKHEQDKKHAEERLKSEKEYKERNFKLEEDRLQLEQENKERSLKLEEDKYLFEKEKYLDEKKFRMRDFIVKILSVVSSFFGAVSGPVVSLIAIGVYLKLAKTSLKLEHVDNEIVSKDYKKNMDNVSRKI